MIARKLQQRLIQSSKSGSESGFTIIESLAAIIVVTLLMVGITPMLGLAVANRVQARRVELASQAARTYIDYLRSEEDATKHPAIETDPAIGSDLNQLKSRRAINSTGTLTCNDGAYCTTPGGNELFCVDGNGDGACNNETLADMVVQGVGYNPSTGATARDGYYLLVRVYRADAFKGTGDLKTEGLQRIVTAGVPDRTLPVVQMTTEMVVGGSGGTSYQDFWDRQCAVTPKPAGCP